MGINNPGSGGGAGALTLLKALTADGTSGLLTFTAIDQTYRDLILVLSARCSNNGGAGASVLLNNDSGTNYSYEYAAGGSNSGFNPQAAGAYNYGGNNIPAMYLLGPDAPDGNIFTNCELTVYNYANTAMAKEYQQRYRSPHGNGSLPDNRNGVGFFITGVYYPAAAVTRLDAVAQTGNFVAGSIARLFGRQ